MHALSSWVPRSRGLQDRAHLRKLRDGQRRRHRQTTRPNHSARSPRQTPRTPGHGKLKRERSEETPWERPPLPPEQTQFPITPPSATTTLAMLHVQPTTENTNESEEEPITDYEETYLTSTDPDGLHDQGPLKATTNDEEPSPTTSHLGPDELDRQESVDPTRKLQFKINWKEWEDSEGDMDPAAITDCICVCAVTGIDPSCPLCEPSLEASEQTPNSRKIIQVNQVNLTVPPSAAASTVAFKEPGSLLVQADCGREAPLPLLIDTGANVCCISETLYQQIKPTCDRGPAPELANLLVTGANGQELQSTNHRKLRFHLGNTEVLHPFLIVQDTQPDLFLGGVCLLEQYCFAIVLAKGETPKVMVNAWTEKERHLLSMHNTTVPQIRPGHVNLLRRDPTNQQPLFGDDDQTPNLNETRQEVPVMALRTPTRRFQECPLNEIPNEPVTMDDLDEPDAARGTLDRDVEPEGLEFPEDGEEEEALDPFKILSKDTKMPAGMAKRLAQYFTEHKQVVSQHAFDIGRLKTDHKMEIPLVDESQPMSTKPYRLSPIRQQQIDQALSKMEKQGLVVRKDSPYTSPCFLITKAAGSDGIKRCRLVIDYRRLNSMSVKASWPLPRIDDLLGRLQNKAFYSNIDLRSAYNHIELSEDAGRKSAVITPGAIFVPTRLQFGVASAPSKFSMIISDIMKSMEKNTAVYLDDIIIFTENPDVEEHYERIIEALQCLEKAGMKIHLEKCEFFKRQLKFLGKLLSASGTKPLPKHVQLIKNFPQPKTVVETQRFLGLVNWLSSFINNYSAHINALCKAINKGNFLWGPEQEEAFVSVKNAIAEDTMKFHVDYSRPLYLAVDSSDETWGAILYQVCTYQKSDIPMLEKLIQEEKDVTPWEKSIHPVLPPQKKGVPKLLSLQGNNDLFSTEDLLHLADKRTKRKKKDEDTTDTEFQIPDLLDHDDSYPELDNEPQEGPKLQASVPHEGGEGPRVVPVNRVKAGNFPKYNLSDLYAESDCVHVVRVCGFSSGFFRGAAMNYNTLEKEATGLLHAINIYRDQLNAAVQAYCLSDANAYCWLLRYNNQGISKLERLCIKLYSVPHRVIVTHCNGLLHPADPVSRFYKVPDRGQPPSTSGYKRAIIVETPFKPGSIVTLEEIVAVLKERPNIVLRPSEVEELKRIQEEGPTPEEPPLSDDKDPRGVSNAQQATESPSDDQDPREVDPSIDWDLPRTQSREVNLIQQLRVQGDRARALATAWWRPEADYLQEFEELQRRPQSRTNQNETESPSDDKDLPEVNSPERTDELTSEDPASPTPPVANARVNLVRRHLDQKDSGEKRCDGEHALDWWKPEAQSIWHFDEIRNKLLGCQINSPSSESLSAPSEPMLYPSGSTAFPTLSTPEVKASSGELQSGPDDAHRTASVHALTGTAPSGGATATDQSDADNLAQGRTETDLFLHVPAVLAPMTQATHLFKSENIALAQRQDEHMANIISRIHDDPKLQKNYRLEGGLLKKRTNRTEFDADDQYLYTQLSPFRIYLPPNLVAPAAAYYHTTSHSGTKSLCRLLRCEYYADNLTKVVTQLTRACYLCMVYKPRCTKPYLEGIIPRVGPKGTCWDLDVVTGLIPYKGKDSYLSMVENVSGYRMAVAVRHTLNSEQVVEFVDLMITKPFSPPSLLRSDNGTNMLNSRAMHRYAALHNIQLHTSVPYSPQSHGNCETHHRYITTGVNILAEQLQRPWTELLSVLCSAFNARPTRHHHPLTPAEILLARNTRAVPWPLPRERLLNDPETEMKRMAEVDAKLEKMLAKATETQLRDNLKKGGKNVDYPRGTIVYLKEFQPGLYPKSRYKFRPSPHLVLAQYPQVLILRSVLGTIVRAHKRNVRVVPVQDLQILRRLPTGLAHALEAPFSLEEVRKAFRENRIPNFWLPPQTPKKPDRMRTRGSIATDDFDIVYEYEPFPARRRTDVEDEGGDLEPLIPPDWLDPDDDGNAAGGRRDPSDTDDEAEEPAETFPLDISPHIFSDRKCVRFADDPDATINDDEGEPRPGPSRLA